MATDRMQLKLRDRSPQAEKQATIGAAGIIHAIAIGNEASAHAADIQERIPVGTIASQRREVDR